jgi:hypothetical protein
MGANAWFAAYFNGDPKEVLKANPKLNRTASREHAEGLLLDVALKEKEDGTLEFLNPSKREVYVGDYGDLKIIAHEALGVNRLSQVDPRWYSPALGSTAYLHATHSVIDWFAFARWHNGTLVRALSVSPDAGVIEDIGEKLPFETPYWNGAYALEQEEGEEPYPLLFHPLELAQAALLENLGFQFEGRASDWVCEPWNIKIAHFEIRRIA